MGAVVNAVPGEGIPGVRRNQNTCSVREHRHVNIGSPVGPEGTYNGGDVWHSFVPSWVGEEPDFNEEPIKNHLMPPRRDSVLPYRSERGLQQPGENVVPKRCYAR